LLIDARTLPENKIIKTDVCIIGAGPAGITLAHEFIGQPFRVCLLESGGLELDEKTQSLSEGENVGLSYFPLETTRFRYFGGTLGKEAWCWQLDEIDFETRDWIPYSGWPFSKSHLDPFYERAQSILRLRHIAHDVEAWETKNSPCLLFIGDRVITKIIQISPSIRFGEIYRDEVERADNIHTYLYANVLDIETTYTARTVTHLQVACLQGNKFWVEAKLFILATGGIENARLLLLSNKVQRAGLGNQNDLVGRFFMEHPHLESGIFIPSDPYISAALHTLYNYECKVNNIPVIRAVALSAQTLRHEKLVNFSATLESSCYQVSNGVTSLELLLKALRQRNMPDGLIKHLSNVIVDINDVATAAYRKLFKGNSYPVKFFRLYNRTEQASNPNSRVTLTAERDCFGKNRVQLDWRLSPIDKSSLRRAHEIIRLELDRAGLGRLMITLDDNDTTWPLSLTGGHHHMGTTRMHVDPKRGVANENCQVHGISNLFIAGSSLFPTSGCANPTLTIVALAVRLADHMKRLMIC